MEEYPETKISIPLYGRAYAIDFEDALDISLDYPYSREEWDIIFTKYFDLLKHKESWIRFIVLIVNQYIF